MRYNGGFRGADRRLGASGRLSAERNYLDSLANPWRPVDLPNLICWFRAGDAVFQDAAGTTPATADGDPVGLWKDLGPLGNSLSQSTSAQRPTLKLNQVNGCPVLRFDGVSSNLAGSLAATYVQPFTLYGMWKVSSGSGDYFCDDQSGTSRVVMGIGLSTSGRLGMAATTVMEGSASYTIGGYDLLTAVCNGVTSALRLNADPHAAGNGGSTSLVSFRLGTRYNSQSGTFLNGDIVELIAYSGAHNAASRAQLTGYFSARYGVPV